MQIRFGYDISFEHPAPTPLVLMTILRGGRSLDLVKPDLMTVDPPVPVAFYDDLYGNRCARVVAPAGTVRFTADALINDTGLPEPAVLVATQHDVGELPPETLIFLLRSAYCDTELLSPMAWQLFAGVTPGWPRVQAICDFVHDHIRFDYQQARATRTASEAFHERVGVCRDYAHLAVTLCRCMNIPARYCTGYLGDIGVPPVPDPMDFAAYFEAFLGGQWHTFDPRNNRRRIGRLPIACGRDAADVAITTTFGPNLLTSFRVWTDEVAS